MIKKQLLLVILILLIVGGLNAADQIKTAGAVVTTVYIRFDGSVEPFMSPIISSDNVTYAFTNDLDCQVVVERDDIILDGSGFRLLGNGTGKGIDLSHIHNVTVKNLEINGFHMGVWVYNGSNHKIIGNTIVENTFGVWLFDSNNTVSENKMLNNSDTGVVVDFSTSNNTIIRNSFTNNSRGIWIIHASENRIYHNNFVNNIQHAYVDSSLINYWDNDVEGNFWDDYAGVDISGGGDGVGDSPYAVNIYNVDYFPLMGLVTFFDVGLWDGNQYYFHVISNSSALSFNFNDTNKLVSFNVTGLNATGFSRVAIPRQLLWCENLNDWIVRVNGSLVPFDATGYDDYTYLYFTYSHSESKVEIYGTSIIPEFPSTSVLTILMLLCFTIASTFYKSRT